MRATPSPSWRDNDNPLRTLEAGGFEPVFVSFVVGEATFVSFVLSRAKSITTRYGL